MTLSCLSDTHGLTTLIRPEQARQDWHPGAEVIVRFFAFLLFVLSLFATSLFAQAAGTGGRTSAPNPTQQLQEAAQDGGVTETLQSIFIPPKTQAPFSLTLHTEWVKTLADGGTMTLVNQRRISRDSRGRISQERAWLVPKAGKLESQAYLLQIADPYAHAVYNCFKDARRECVQLSYTGSTSTEYKQASRPTGDLPNGIGRAEHEDLGKQLIDGIETVGTRDRIIYNPGVFGNDQIVTVEREYWYSPQLGINLLSILSDPRIGKQTFRAADIVQSEPEASLFKVPAGFKVVAPTHPPETQSGPQER